MFPFNVVALRVIIGGQRSSSDGLRARFYLDLFFPWMKFFYFSNLKEIIYTPKLYDKI